MKTLMGKSNGDRCWATSSRRSHLVSRNVFCRIWAELLDVVRRRGRGRGDTSEDEEDLGLPRSPCNSPTATDKVLKEHPTKSHSTCSDGSLLSMGSSEMEEDSFGQHSKNSSKVSLHDRRASQNTDLELELGTTLTAVPLSHSAARHKMAVKPKRTHGAPRRRRAQQLTTVSALPTTPEVNEDLSARSVTPECSTKRETIAELYTARNSVWNMSTSIVSETQLKSASLPPGLALPTANKLSRSRSNAGTKETFTEEDELDDKSSKEEKKKEDSFFGRFLARRSGKKKKLKSEESECITSNVQITSKTTSVYKHSEERRFESSVSNVPRSGPAARQRVQPIDIPSSPDLYLHRRQQQNVDVDLPMPPTNNSPEQNSILSSSPPSKKPAYSIKPSTSPEKRVTELSELPPIPTPRTILPHSLSPPKTLPPIEITCKQTANSYLEESKTKVKITGLSAYQQRVLSYNDDEFDHAGFKTVEEMLEDSNTTVPVTTPQFKSNSVINSTQDHGSLPFTVNNSIYDPGSESETFTDSLMSTVHSQLSEKSNTAETINDIPDVSIISTNTDLPKEQSGEPIQDDAENKDSLDNTVPSDLPDCSTETIENKTDIITISCVNSQMQASVNTKSSNEVVVSISNPADSLVLQEQSTSSVCNKSVTETSIRETSSQVSVTKVQLKREQKLVESSSTFQIPEFLKIQLNKVDIKPSTNVVLSTSSSFSKADDKLRQKSVLEIETDRENGEMITDNVKRKFSADDVEIVDKENNTSSETTVPLTVNNNEEITQIRKSSLRSSESNSAAPFLKKKSNSLELSDCKLKDDRNSLGFLTKKLANSSDQLSSNKTDKFFNDAQPEVNIRKKSLVSQQRNQDSDEPELMKVFARRSLKLKDSEAETLSQQVLVLMDGADVQNADASENSKRDSDKENECSESPEERKKQLFPLNSSKEVSKPKEPLAEKFVETADVTLRKPPPVLNNKLSAFVGTKYPRVVSLATPVSVDSVTDNEKRKNLSFIEPKTEKISVITNYRSHILSKDKEFSDIKRCIKTSDEFITNVSLKTDFENEDFERSFKKIQQRKEEWEKRAQQNMKKSSP